LCQWKYFDQEPQVYSLIWGTHFGDTKPLEVVARADLDDFDAVVAVAASFLFDNTQARQVSEVTVYEHSGQLLFN
jgi:hypothetical protein